MRSKGFTLVEVMVVTAIFASISIGIFMSLSNGIRLWTRTQKIRTDEDVTIFLDRFAQDVRNAFVFSEIAFEGKELSVSLPTVVTVVADPRGSRAHEGDIDQIGKVRYSFDINRRWIVREQANYSQATKGTFASAQTMVEKVKSVRFLYYYPGQKAPSFYAGGDLPSGVEIEVHFAGSDGDKVFERYVPIPAGA